jgi:hypothetical protein
LSLGGDVWQVEHGTPSFRANNGIANAAPPLPQATAQEIKGDNIKSAFILFPFILGILKLLFRWPFTRQQAILETLRP